jgi:hypothetical protein
VLAGLLERGAHSTLYRCSTSGSALAAKTARIAAGVQAGRVMTWGRLARGEVFGARGGSGVQWIWAPSKHRQDDRQRPGGRGERELAALSGPWLKIVQAATAFGGFARW